LADRAARHVLSRLAPDYRAYSFLDRGSDERQYCYPRIDMPVASVMRSRYNTYPEYHTSLDNLDLVSPAGLGGAFNVYHEILSLLEEKAVYRVTTICEPRLGARNLYPDLQRKEISDDVVPILNLLAYADGRSDLLQISETIGVPMAHCIDLARRLAAAGLI